MPGDWFYNIRLYFEKEPSDHLPSCDVALYVRRFNVIN